MFHSLQVLKDSLTVASCSQSSRPLRLNEGEELGDELCLIRQVFMMYDHRREGRLTIQEVRKLITALITREPGQ